MSEPTLCTRLKCQEPKPLKLSRRDAKTFVEALMGAKIEACPICQWPDGSHNSSCWIGALAIKWREAEHQIAQLQADLAVARQQIAEYRDVVIPAMDRTISHQVERASRAESYLAEARRESDHHRDVMNNNARIAHRLDAENARLKEALEAMLIHHGHHGCQPLFGQCAHTTARALLAQEEK